MRVSPPGPWLLLWLVTAVGCGEVPDEEPLPAGSGVTETGLGEGDRSAAPEDTLSTAASHSAYEDAEPSPFPDLDGEAVVRTYELWLVNRSRTDALVYASAGAGRVTLDTVPGRDSVRVNVEVRARRLSLDAEDENGRALGSTELELAPASSNRWVIPDPGEAR